MTVEVKAKVTVECNYETAKQIVRFLEIKYAERGLIFYIERKLTKREKEILNLICKSKSNNEIGKILNISHNTVKVHVKNICEKLNVKDRIQIAVKAVKENLCE